MKRRRRFFDWRFLVSLTVLLLAAYLVFGGLELARDNRAKSARVDVLVAELRHQHADAEAERHAAAAERAQLLAGQQALAEKYDVLIWRQTALLNYLRKHGIDVPERFIVTTRTVSSGGTSGTVRRRSSVSGGSTATAPAPAPVPGKSGGRGKAHQRGKP